MEELHYTRRAGCWWRCPACLLVSILLLCFVQRDPCENAASDPHLCGDRALHKGGNPSTRRGNPQLRRKSPWNLFLSALNTYFNCQRPDESFAIALPNCCIPQWANPPVLLGIQVFHWPRCSYLSPQTSQILRGIKKVFFPLSPAAFLATITRVSEDNLSLSVWLCSSSETASADR